LSSCTNESETKALLGMLLQTLGRHPAPRPSGMNLPANNMVSIPAANNSMTA
jgi:hypothetical protein